MAEISKQRSDAMCRRVVLYGCPDYADAGSHQCVTLAQIARKIAAVAGYVFAGAFETCGEERQAEAKRKVLPFYFVPSDTVVGLDHAAMLGIQGAADLFGGVVPFAFVSTKAITHGLVAPGAAAPEGWCSGFAERTQNIVLPGFTTFTRDDAALAGRRLLEDGLVRLKEPCGIGGLGQQVVADAAALDRALAGMDRTTLETHGIVLERDLDEPRTWSVGQIEVAGLRASYCGTQDLTSNNRGHPVYGGSTLTVVRGGFEELLAQPFHARALAAVRAATIYHEAALACFPGMFLSRCNYDVAAGRAAGGNGVRANAHTLLGVLEQSWRVGGATGAELAALAALQAHPECRRVVASTREIYGVGAEVPPGAEIYFQGEDRHVGALTKYALLEPDANGNA
ncbi:hypothetical protein OR16_04047 [Cupriavidus basilensis OR16]|uniref:Biotin carboxylase n=1 Tax=Cupriavidus basilensis OR16 TaxID=1127483 RepID=H1RZR0_9BURK|nr:hypothetical protein OR16_04047 [Cupriavidus basilensis OR16]